MHIKDYRKHATLLWSTIPVYFGEFLHFMCINGQTGILCDLFTEWHGVSLLINVDKTKVIVSDGRACCILIQNEELEQVDTFPYLGSLITVDGECTTEFRTRGQAIGASLQKIWKSHSILISTEI